MSAPASVSEKIAVGNVADAADTAAVSEGMRLSTPGREDAASTHGPIRAVDRSQQRVYGIRHFYQTPIRAVHSGYNLDGSTFRSVQHAYSRACPRIVSISRF